MQKLSIGAVSRLTGTPGHTLRKWESRHGIAVPDRSDTGRRVYGEAHVDQINLVRQLLNAGHSLGDLSGLEVEELRKLAGLHETASIRQEFDSLLLVGHNVSRLLLAHGFSITRFEGAPQRWLESQADEVVPPVVVFESDTLSEFLIEKLVDLQGKFQAVFFVYAFASTRDLNVLQRAGVRCLRGPVTDETLLLYLEGGPRKREVAEEASPKFTTDELSRLALLGSGLQCECPNHIAKLLMEISAFEKYSSECVDADPSERALHERLYEVSGQARRLFEEALISVAAADGIELSGLG